MAFTTDDARAYIAEVRWQFAKTMPRWPHEYTVREWRPDLEREFLEFVALIRRDGIVKPWPRDAATPRYRLTYLELDGWEYWTMGAPLLETTVINRADARASSETAGPDLTMNVREAREFIASVPWRAVRMVEVGDTGKTPDPHEYVIKEWREVDTNLFDAFVRLIKAEGYRARYRAPYRPDHVMTNHYLEINGWCYWFIYPSMLNRERAEDRKHEPIPD